MKYEYKTDENEILGIRNNIESTGYNGGDSSETKITMETTTVWGGYTFNIEHEDHYHPNMGHQKIIIFANGDSELQDLIKSLKWLTNKLEIIEKDDAK